MDPNGHREYKINCKLAENPDMEYSVKRRYRHFEWLRKKLLSKYEIHAVPILPEKNLLEKLYGDGTDFVKERQRCLSHFLSLIISHDTLSKAEVVRTFLTEKDSVSTRF